MRVNLDRGTFALRACVTGAVLCLCGPGAEIAHGQNVGSCSIDNKSWAPTPSSIAAGGSSKVTVYFTCYNQTTGLDDTITVQIPGLPKGATWLPTEIITTGGFSGNQTITITTTRQTKPGTYAVAVGGAGKVCTSIVPPCGAPDNGNWALTITGKPAPKPKISSEGNKNAVWWFNGAKPSGFTKKLTLTATQEGNNKFTWNVDGKFAKFVDATTNPAVLEADCEIGTPCPPQGEGMVSVTVTGLEVTSDPFPVSVLTPYQAIPLPVPPDDPDNKGAGALFYFSHIPYQITDQFGKPLPKKPPVREHFTASAVNQCPNCNWHASHEGGSGEAGRLGSTGCSTAGPGIVCDTISGQAKDQLPFVPSVPTPECPNNNCTAPSIGSSTLKVICFPGELWIGNGASPPAPPTGVKVMTMIWERYQDHARHCNILSPLDGSGSVADACSCP